MAKDKKEVLSIVFIMKIEVRDLDQIKVKVDLDGDSINSNDSYLNVDLDD